LGEQRDNTWFKPKIHPDNNLIKYEYNRIRDQTHYSPYVVVNPDVCEGDKLVRMTTPVNTMLMWSRRPSRQLMWRIGQLEGN